MMKPVDEIVQPTDVQLHIGIPVVWFAKFVTTVCKIALKIRQI